MKERNNLLEKSFSFAFEVVKICQRMASEKREFVLSRQLLRSGTSVGANCEEAMGAQSNADFYAKITIAYKEARETSYWIRLLHRAEYLRDAEAARLSDGIHELLRIIGIIQLNLKQRALNRSTRNS